MARRWVTMASFSAEAVPVHWCFIVAYSSCFWHKYASRSARVESQGTRPRRHGQIYQKNKFKLSYEQMSSLDNHTLLRTLDWIPRKKIIFLKAAASVTRPSSSTNEASVSSPIALSGLIEGSRITRLYYLTGWMRADKRNDRYDAALCLGVGMPSDPTLSMSILSRKIY